MQDVEYHEQSRTVLWGSHTTARLPELLKRFGVSRVMIVAGKSICTSPHYQKITESLGDSFIGVFDGVKAHVPEDTVQAGVTLARFLGIDVIVSVGGGSVAHQDPISRLDLGAPQIDAHTLARPY